MSTIFISHSSEDNAWAERIRDWLQGSANKQQPDYRYQSLFLDFDPEQGIPVGRSWRETLYEKLQLCRAVIVICSAAYGQSQWCLAELGVAMASGKLVLPVRIDGSPPLRLLSETQRTPLVPIDLDTIGLEGWQRLERGLAALSWQERLAWPPENEPNASPFPGLSCFERKHAPVFFGQDQTLRQAQAKVEAITASASRFLLILGASGCGKSSLLRAGLVPWLAGAEPGRWIVLDPFRPGRKPFRWLDVALEKAFLAAGQTPPSEPARTEVEILEQLEELRVHTGQQDARVVIAIDQFEELLGRGDEREEAKPTEADDFLSILAELLKLEGSRVLILATLRSDFLGSLQLHPSRLNSLVGDPILLGPMDVDGFRQVIEGPARRVGLRLETGLSDRLVRDTPSGDALPLLAFTLRELWAGRADGAGLTLKQYDDFGGLAGAVQRKADEVLATSGATEEEIEALERAFIDRLVRLTSDGQAAKQPAGLDALPAASRRLVGLFVEARLLVSGKGSDGAAVEIAHEALLRAWPKLVGWIEKGREALLQRLQVRRMSEDLKPDADEAQRRRALEQLAILADGGGTSAIAVQQGAKQSLMHLLGNPEAPEADRKDAILVLALIGEATPLRKLLANKRAPVSLRRRAAECMGFIAAKSTDRELRGDLERELEQWLTGDHLNIWINRGAPDQSKVAQLTQVMDRYIEKCAKSGTLTGLSQEQIHSARSKMLGDMIRELPLESTGDPGWTEHDARLPILQGAARGLQLATASDLPLIGSGDGRSLPMLCIAALNDEDGMSIRSEVVQVKTWSLPLPLGANLEIVSIPGGSYTIGSPSSEIARDRYIGIADESCALMDIEAVRTVELESFYISRMPISQGQWQAVQGLPRVNHELKSNLPTSRAADMWEQVTAASLPMGSLTWGQCDEWLNRLNLWLAENWSFIGGVGVSPHLCLPSESQWEVACRAGSIHPFHFGDTLDATWANIHGEYVYGRGRKGQYLGRALPLGAFGLVNRWGLVDMHGQVAEWCKEFWRPNPLDSASNMRSEYLEDFRAHLGNRTGPRETWKVLRGGCWYVGAENTRSAFRMPFSPSAASECNGIRPVLMLQ